MHPNEQNGYNPKKTPNKNPFELIDNHLFFLGYRLFQIAMTITAKKRKRKKESKLTIYHECFFR